MNNSYTLCGILYRNISKWTTATCYRKLLYRNGNKWKLHARWNTIQQNFQLNTIFMWNVGYVHMDQSHKQCWGKGVSHRIYEVQNKRTKLNYNLKINT